MVATHRTYEYLGRKVIEQLNHNVNTNLTREIQDLVFELVVDHVEYSRNSKSMMSDRDPLRETIHYYVSEVCVPERADFYKVIADERNNPRNTQAGTFIIDISFQAKGSLIATKLRYTITY